MAGIPVSVKPVLPVIVGAAVGITFTAFWTSFGVLAILGIWAGIFLAVFGFYAFGWRKEAATLRKERDERSKTEPAKAEPAKTETAKRETAVTELEQRLAVKIGLVKDRENAVTQREKAAALKNETKKETIFGFPAASRPSQICDPGPHVVEPRSYLHIELNVSSNMKVSGRLEEIDGLPFDWAILHETELVKFLQGRKVRVALEGHDELAYPVEWIVPGVGPWFLVFNNYAKGKQRTVGVHLR